MTIALPQPLVLESPMSQLWCTSELLPSNCDEIPLQALKRTTSPFCLEIMYGHLSSFGKWIVRSDRYQFQAEPLCCLQQCSIRNFISLHQIWTEILHKCVMFIWCKGGVNFVVSNHWTFEAIGYCHLIYMNLTKQYVPLLCRRCACWNGTYTDRLTTACSALIGNSHSLEHEQYLFSSSVLMNLEW